MTTLTKSGVHDVYAALVYLADGPGHNGAAERNVATLSHGLPLMNPAGAMMRTISRATVRRSDALNAVMVVRSAGLDEVPPDDDEACLRYLEESHAMAMAAYPGRQVYSAGQRDGRTGCFHVHSVVCAVAFEEAEWSYKVRDRTPGAPEGSLVDVSEHVAPGSRLPHGMDHLFRLRRLSDEFARDWRGLDNQSYMDEHTAGERVTPSVRAKREAGEYVWSDDLKSRIDVAAGESATMEEFRESLGRQGVEVRQRGKKGHLSYGFTDADGKPRRSRSGGRSGLGSDYGVDGVGAMLERTRTARARRAPQHRTTSPVTRPVELAPKPAPVADPSRSWLDDLNAEVEAEMRQQDEESATVVEEPVEESVEAEIVDDDDFTRALSSVAARVAVAAELDRAREADEARQAREAAEVARALSERPAEGLVVDESVPAPETPPLTGPARPSGIRLRHADEGVPTHPDFGRYDLGLGE